METKDFIIRPEKKEDYGTVENLDLAERESCQVVLKQIHHEPCDYYSFT